MNSAGLIKFVIARDDEYFGFEFLIASKPFDLSKIWQPKGNRIFSSKIFLVLSNNILPSFIIIAFIVRLFLTSKFYSKDTISRGL